MRISKGIFLLLGIAAVLTLAIYWIPAVHERLSWRVDFAMAYMRNLIDPVEPLPSPAPHAKTTIPPPLQMTHTPAPSVTATRSATAALSPTATLSPTPRPTSVQLPSPQWEKQDINNCGPAALTMYLRFYGWEGDQTTVTDVIKPFREDRNVNVEELAYYVRTQAGWLNFQYRVGGDLELLKNIIAAGIPVMIEESFYFEEPFWPNDDLWAAHYNLLTGYDDERELFTGQDSYYGPDQKIPYRKLDEYWQTFNRVYILIYLPQQEASVKNILGENWDPDTNRQHALDISQAETESDPKNPFTWFNLGTNLTYFERYFEATSAFDRARELGLPQRMLRYQFSPFIAYFHTGLMDDLITLVDYALKITPNSEEAWLWHGWAMYRKGDSNQAAADFQRALEENPLYLDAQYAIDFIQSNP